MNLLWLQSGGCGGCTMSLLCHEPGDVVGVLRDGDLELLWHPALSEATGSEAVDILRACIERRTPLDVLCVEGALLRGPGGSGRFHMLAGTGRPMIDWVVELAAVARYVVAVGSCAAFGGVCGAGPNPTEACGLQFEDEHPGGLLGPQFRATSGMQVINVAGCPTHPGWVVETLLALAMGEFGPDDLDAFGRPRFYAEQLVHHGCNRNEYYEFKAAARHISELGCLMENLGCKGTQAHADCNVRPWNGTGSCTTGGYSCIGCTEPGFEEPGHPFAQTPKVAGIPIGLPSDMPKAWFVALAALSKSATPQRVRANATSDHALVPPAIRQTRFKGPR